MFPFADSKRIELKKRPDEELVWHPLRDYRENGIVAKNKTKQTVKIAKVF